MSARHTFALRVYGRTANIITAGKKLLTLRDMRNYEQLPFLTSQPGRFPVNGEPSDIYNGDKARQNKHKLLKRLRPGISYEW